MLLAARHSTDPFDKPLVLNFIHRKQDSFLLYFCSYSLIFSYFLFISVDLVPNVDIHGPGFLFCLRFCDFS